MANNLLAAERRKKGKRAGIKFMGRIINKNTERRKKNEERRKEGKKRGKLMRNFLHDRKNIYIILSLRSSTGIKTIKVKLFLGEIPSLSA